jgi:hypothetical protein
MKVVVHSVVITALLVLPAQAQWDPDVRLTFADEISRTGASNTWSIQAVHDSIFIVWTDARDGNSEIYFKRSLDAGITWEPDVRLTDDAAFSALPSILVHGTMIHVAWYDTRAGMNNFEIYYKRSTDAGETWGQDTRLTYDPDISWYQSIALSGSNLHVVWRETRDGNYDIFYKRSPDQGVTWNADTNLTQAPGSSETPCITSYGSILHVLWFDNRDGGAYEIYYKRSTDQGLTWESDRRLTYDSGVSFGPCAVARDSIVHVVFQDSRHGNWELFYLCSTDYGVTWNPEVRLTDASETSEAPSVAVSASNVHITWWDNRDGNYEIYYKTSTDRGVTWLPDERLTNDGSWSQNPHIAAADSMLHVIWQDGRAGNDEIYYKRNPTGNPGVTESIVGNAPAEPWVATTLFRNIITIQFHQYISDGIDVILYDISGAKVYERHFSGIQTHLVLNDHAMQQLPAGVYFLHINIAEYSRTAKTVKIK